MAKQSNDQSGCEGTVTDFKTGKYIIRYIDGRYGTTATLTKTALMRVLSPVHVETTVAAAAATTVGQIAADSASEAIEAPIDLYVQPDQAAEPAGPIAETTRLTRVQKTSAANCHD